MSEKDLTVTDVDSAKAEEKAKKSKAKKAKKAKKAAAKVEAARVA